MNFNGKVAILVTQIPADWEMPQGRLSKILFFLNLLKIVWQIFYCGACNLISCWYCDFCGNVFTFHPGLCQCNIATLLVGSPAFPIAGIYKVSKPDKACNVFREKQCFCKCFWSPSISPPLPTPAVFSWETGSRIRRHSARFCRWMGIPFWEYFKSMKLN